MANPNIVSVSSIYAGNAAWDLTTSTNTTLWTVAADVVAKINYIGATNSHATTAATVTLDINGIGTAVTGVSGTSLATQAFICNEISVPGDDLLVIIDKPIYLMEADVLRGSASVATISLFISFEILNDA